VSRAAFRQPDAPGEKPCFGRKEELGRLRRRVRDLAREWGKSVLVWGPPGAGKTALLQTLSSSLRQEGGDIFPFYYSMPKLEWSVSEFAADFTDSFAAQYIAHTTGDPDFLREVPGPAVLESRLREDDTAGGRYLREVCRNRREGRAGRSPSLEAALLPDRFAAAGGGKVLAMIDDFAHLAHYRPPELIGWPREALRSWRAPMVLTGRTAGEIGSLLGRGEVAGLFDLLELQPLPEEDALQMMRSLLRVGGVEMPEELAGEAVRLSGRMPFAMEALVRCLAGRGDIDEAALYRSYAETVCRGEVRRYWLDILSDCFPYLSKRKTALELVVFCIREEPLSPAVERLSSSMLKPPGEVEEALEGLKRAGLLTVDCSRVRITVNPTFKDFILSLYRGETGGSGLAFVEASVAAEKMRCAGEEKRREVREGGKKRLRTLLESWSGQQVPKTLFAGGGVGADGADEGDDALLERPEKSGDLLRLPRVVSVASGFVGPGSGPPLVEIDAAAWAMQPGIGGREKKVCWLVRLHDAAAVDEEYVDEFVRGVSALQTGEELGGATAVRWIISREGFTPGALERTRRERILASTVRQAALLGRMIGTEVGTLLPAPEETARKRRTLEFEMTIPMVSETELVAARAVEQLAENMNFDSNETGRIKMALVEACINAFEHSGLAEGKVRLFFTVEGDSLIIRVENRGRRFAPQRIAPARGKKEMSQRGWGLSLIKELMDEVEFDRREDGVRLVMVKHLRGKEGSGEQVRDDD
jgi:serine/threonine-protein kinase RsbW